MNKLLLDLKYVSRLLVKSPAFALTSLTIIVVGIVLYLCTYSLVYNFNNTPLPYERGDRFVAFQTIYSPSGEAHFGENFDEFSVHYIRERATQYEELYGYRFLPLTLSDGEFPQQYTGAAIEPSILGMTKVQPTLGRLFTESDAYDGAQPVAIISYDVWQNYYAGNPDVIDQTSRINGQYYNIIGVMPDKFDYPAAQDVWLPYSISAGAVPSRILDLAMIGVLKPNSNVDLASQEASKLMRELAEQYPDIHGASPNAKVVTHSAFFNSSSELGTLLNLLNNAVLALVALNLGILLFYRAHSRQRELAIRCAMGANQFNIARQILLESALLCSIGLVVSLGLAAILLFFMGRIITDLFASDGATIFSWMNFSIDGHALLVAIGITFSLWFLSGVWVAYRTSRLDANTILAAGSKGSGGQSSNWMTRIIVGIEVTASCFILIVSALLFVVIIKLAQVDFGVNTDRVMTASIQLRGVNYSQVNERLQFVEELQRDLNNNPNFQASTIALGLPGQGGELFPYLLEDRDLSGNQGKPFITNIAVTDSYFDTLDISIIEGRSFSSSDNHNSLPVTVIDEILAQQMWPNESALGKRIGLDIEGAITWLTIVGVNQHVIHGEPTAGQENRPVIYRPVSQFTPFWYQIAARYKPGVTEQEAINGIKSAVKRQDGELAVSQTQTLQALLDNVQTTYLFIARVAIFFGLATLVFSIIGVYGLIVRSVIARRQEVGVRLSLGSSAAKILWLFLRQGIFYLGVGVILGGTAAVLASNLLTLLFTDALSSLPPVFIAVTSIMAAMILLASYLPAKQALALEPGDALRDE